MNIPNKTANYNSLSGEYYDPNLHPTSNNLRAASKKIIGKILKNLEFANSNKFLEVGAGRSVVAEIFLDLHYSLSNLIITDVHESMLNYSNIYLGAASTISIANAERIHDSFSGIDCIISSLGDPYNTPSFWQSCYKTLDKNGFCIFTTPSYDWATQFRKQFQGGDLDHAKFVLNNGLEVNVPSYVYSKEDQVNLAKSAGFEVIKYEEVPLKEISGNISSKLMLSQGDNLLIVTSYLFKKNAS